MSAWVEVLRAPLSQDLAPFCRYLGAAGVATYVFERGGMQALCVPQHTDETRLRRLLDDWQAGRVDQSAFAADRLPATARETAVPTVFAFWWRFPLTLLLCAVSVLVYLLVATPPGQAVGGLQLLAALTLQPLSIRDGEMVLLAQLPSLTALWRYWTPMFLHFSGFHILFNGLMLLELGRRIEIPQGSQRLLFLVMACGLISNLAQFYADASALFGGMSGVIYALAGYCWFYQRLRPEGGVLAPPGLMLMVVLWLLLCFSGLVTLAGFGRIANAAHVGGLLAGLGAALLFAALDRRWPDR